MRAYDPVTAVENQPKIIAELKKRLQEKYGQMLEILEVTQTNAFVFDSKAVNDAISAASEAKTRVSAVDAQVGAIKKEGEKTKAEADSFKLKTPEQRDYELKQQVVKQGGNPFQPGYPPTNLAPQK